MIWGINAETEESLRMSADAKAIVKQIDDLLAKCSPDVNSSEQVSRVANVLTAAIARLAPRDSPYANHLKLYQSQMVTTVGMSIALEPLRGILLALRSDYESGYLQSVVELVHAELFADFLEMADYLLEQGYKDPAAVVAGSVLEAHLRKLCDKQSIVVFKPDGTSKKADTLNSELTAANVYSKLDQKSVTSWLGLRNEAAHGNYTAYTTEQVKLMLQGVQNFASRYPA
jgi:hypothetical protein